MNVDNIDRFGHCVICHKNLLTKRVVDGKVIDMFLPTYSDTMFLLNNGSQMQVTICKTCKSQNELTSPEIQSNIMEACMKGWELDTKLKVETKEMTEEQREKVIGEYSKLGIDCHSENLDKHVIQNKVIEIMKLSVEEVNEEKK